jgi:hypothetical protein
MPYGPIFLRFGLPGPLSTGGEAVQGVVDEGVGVRVGDLARVLQPARAAIPSTVVFGQRP